MEVSIVKKKDYEVTLKVKDEDISILYILQHELLKDKDVKFAGFALNHPLTQEYTFRIITNGVDPLDALLKAVNTSMNNVKILNDAIKSKVENL